VVVASALAVVLEQVVVSGQAAASVRAAELGPAAQA